MTAFSTVMKRLIAESLRLKNKIAKIQSVGETDGERSDVRKFVEKKNNIKKSTARNQ